MSDPVTRLNAALEIEGASAALNRQVPWLRVFVEGVVIVGSILMACGIEAWWAESKERAEEQNLLTALHSELTDARRGSEEQFGLLDG